MIVSNTTPLINFAIIRRLDILQQLFGKLVVPPAVEHELLRKGKQYPSARELSTHWSMFIEVRGAGQWGHINMTGDDLHPIEIRDWGCCLRISG